VRHPLGAVGEPPPATQVSLGQVMHPGYRSIGEHGGSAVAVKLIGLQQDSIRDLGLFNESATSEVWCQ